MRNDKKWRTLQILIVLFAVVSVLVHLAWFHLKWPKVPVMVDSSQWTHVHTDLFDVTKWMKETWKLKLRSLGLSCQCSQSQPHQAKHSPRCCYVLAAQAGSDEFNSQLTASFSLSSYSSCNINTSTDKVSMEPAHATTVPPLTIGILSLCMQSRNCSTLLYPNQPSILHSSEVSHHSSSCFKCKPSHRYM